MVEIQNQNKEVQNMAKRRMVTCERCGARFRPGAFVYHYNAKTKRYICNSCYRYESRGNKTFLEKYKEQSAASPVGQPVWALIVKAALGLVYFLLGVQALTLGGDGKTRIYLLVLGLAFLAWAVIPVFVARAHKAERQAAIENKIRVEVERVENEPKTCPACGAQTKGTVCEFCGTKL